MSSSRAKILAVDDNEDGLFALEELLTSSGFEVVTARDGKTALAKLRSEKPDIALLDWVMPEMDGIAVTSAAKSDPLLRYIPIVLLTGRNSLDDISEALERGADGYIIKPYQAEELVARVRAALRTVKLYRELKESNQKVENLQREVEQRYEFSHIIGKSRSMQQVYDLIEKVADSTASILITGESGSGKELVAKAIHYNSPRRDKPFVIQNCSAFQDQLLESELFGHVRGAFTGAHRDKPGLFEVADGGTFFLDELGEMSPALQVKLLRVLQDGTFTPVGGTKPKKVDVRVLAATNRDLIKMVGDGTFREDLFYRVSVVTIKLPPLRERVDDIPLLVDSYLGEIAKRAKATPKTFSPDALKALLNYHWPGNIRQLHNEIERAVLLSGKSNIIEASVLSEQLSSGFGNAAPRVDGVAAGKLKEQVESLERAIIEQTLKRCDGNKSEAARELGISRSNLIAKVQAYGIE